MVKVQYEVGIALNPAMLIANKSISHYVVSAESQGD